MKYYSRLLYIILIVSILLVSIVIVAAKTDHKDNNTHKQPDKKKGKNKHTEHTVSWISKKFGGKIYIPNLSGHWSSWSNWWRITYVD